jgi:hypothetical protein
MAITLREHAVLLAERLEMPHVATIQENAQRRDSRVPAP